MSVSGVGSAPDVRAPRGVVVLLAVLTMIGPFTIDTIFPAFPALSTDLGVGPVAVQQTVSVYMLTFAVFSLAHGPLSDALGRRPVILAGLTAYALASAVCAVAPSLGVLLAGRVLQGVVAGAGLVVTRAVARDLFPPHQAQRAMATMSMIFAVAPALAPVIGGWLLTWTSWRGIFWFLAAYAVLATAVTWFLLPESHPVAARTAFRPGALVASLASASRDPAVLRVCLAIAAGFAAMFLYIASAPAIVAGLLHLGPQDYWVQFLPMVSAMVVGSWVVGRLSGRVSTRGLIALGLVVLTWEPWSARPHRGRPRLDAARGPRWDGPGVVRGLGRLPGRDRGADGPAPDPARDGLIAAVGSGERQQRRGVRCPVAPGQRVLRRARPGVSSPGRRGGDTVGLHFRFSGPAGSPSG